MPLPDPLSIPTDVIAHHEAGHAVAATVLGIPYLAVRIIPDEYGKTGVPSKRRPWTFPRPDQKLSGLTDDEWAELVRDDAKWEAWQKKENDEFAFSCWQERPLRKNMPDSPDQKMQSLTTRLSNLFFRSVTHGLKN
jgi:hypothetical protein